MIGSSTLKTTQELEPQSPPHVATPSKVSVFGRLRRVLLSRSVLGLFDQVLVSGTRFLLTILIGRLCGRGELGLYTLAFSLVVSWISIKYSLISLPYTVFAGRDPETRKSYAGSTLIHLLILMAGTSILLAVASLVFAVNLPWLRSFSAFAPMIGILAFAMPLILLWEFTRRYMFANFEFDKAIKIDATLSVCLIVGVLAVNSLGQLSAITALAITGLGCALATTPWLFVYRRDFAFARKSIAASWRKNWNFGRWVFASQLSWSAMSATVPWTLALLFSEVEAGAYGACLTLSYLSNPFIIGIGNSLLPTIATAYTNEGREKVRQIALMSSMLLGICMTLFCIVIAFYGGTILVLILNSEYEGLDTPILLLAIATAVQTMSIGPDIGTQVMERPDLNCRANLIGLLTVVLTSYPLVAKWGVVGGASAWMVGNATAALARWWYFMILLSTPTVHVDSAEARIA